MQHLPRHLLLAAVFLTVCCAERQASATLDLREAAEVAGQRLCEQTRPNRTVRSHAERQHRVRPAATTLAASRPTLPSRPVRFVAPDAADFVRPILSFEQLRLPPPTA